LTFCANGSVRRLADSRAMRDAETTKLSRFHAEFARLDARWQQEWAASGLVPRSPADMLRWRDRLDEALTRFGKLDTQKVEIESLVASLASGKTALTAFLASVGRVADESSPGDALHREAKARIEALQAAWADARARAVAKQHIVRDFAEAEAARQNGEATLAALRQAWPTAMAGIGLSADATAAQAEAALMVWRDIPVPKASYEREGRSVTTMESDLHDFDFDVFNVINRVAPDLKVESAQESLVYISAKLAEARRASERAQGLRDGAAKRATHRTALVVRRGLISSTLADARRTLGLADDASLIDSLDQLAMRYRFETELANLRRDLREIGDGRDEEALRQEREGLDLDQLPGDIARETLEQQQILGDIADASAIHHQKRSEFESLTKGRDAAAAATERVEASTELLSVAERWLLRSAASKLASRAIERHRAIVQDPLIARASVLFALATGDAFAGLAIDYGDDDQPVLIAKRGDGDRVQIAGLSEGTRDQLFLALRLALLDRYTLEPMPFIGDDLLASFDEHRALASLRLSEISRHVLRVCCRRCARTLEIQTVDAVRLHGRNAVWKDVARRLLDDTCQQRTGRYEEDGCWPGFEA
jgi:chromosome segregation protein